MSHYAVLGALELGLIAALVALGIFLAFRILNFPDLTADGSFPLGAAVAAISIMSGAPPWLATLAAALAGCVAGAVTGWLCVRLKILHLLAGILVMTALFSVNLRIMGRPNISLLGEPTVFNVIDTSMPSHYLIPAVMLGIVAACATLVWLLLATQLGLALRASGANPRMAQAQGVNVGALTIFGLALSNSLVALAGGLMAQSQGGADAGMGMGMIVVGLAALVIGESVIGPRSVLRAIAGVIVGALLYRLLVALALHGNALGISAQDLNLVTALLVAVAMVIPRLRLVWKDVHERPKLRSRLLALRNARDAR